MRARWITVESHPHLDKRQIRRLRRRQGTDKLTRCRRCGTTLADHLAGVWPASCDA